MSIKDWDNEIASIIYHSYPDSDLLLGQEFIEAERELIEAEKEAQIIRCLLTDPIPV